MTTPRRASPHPGGPDHDAIIVGAGASGLMCALTAARRGLRVAILERSTGIARKLLVSGGGKCNFTNRAIGADNFISRNPRFCVSALARFTTDDMLAFVDAHGIRYEERTHGRLFCLESARELHRALIAGAERAGAMILRGTEVRGVAKSDAFTLDTNRGAMTARSVVIATGGASHPRIGGNDFAAAVAATFGIASVGTAPGLTPLLFRDADRRAYGTLSGISLPVVATAGGATFDDDLLFTHDGISGPAALQASNYWREGAPVRIDFAPGVDAALFLVGGKNRNALVETVVAELVPARLAATLCRRAGIEGRIRHITDARLADFGRLVNAWEIVPLARDGYAKAEVMLGGVDTAELNSKTMEALRVPGLYFTGECIDVTGQLGGYNLHWAWASGAAAGAELGSN